MPGITNKTKKTLVKYINPNEIYYFKVPPYVQTDSIKCLEN